MNYGLMADVLVVVHFAFVAWVVVGQLLILAGLVCRWEWVRNPWFRALHLLAIAVVAAEAAFSYECPLTTWERQLRVLAHQPVDQASFMGRLANRILFYQAPQEYFELGHMLFGELVFVTFLLAPPRFRRRRHVRPEASAVNERNATVPAPPPLPREAPRPKEEVVHTG